ncbi:ATP-binding protein [candidate division KSB1 bacterium]|nr:ATP-binding protein [candidate division KSB1 bacterium]
MVTSGPIQRFRKTCIARQPFRAPHRTLSGTGLIGGGTTPKLPSTLPHISIESLPSIYYYQIK